VYTLEKVLKMKKDTVSGINFLDEAMKVINIIVIHYFGFLMLISSFGG
jgi:hypothetical protein